MRPVKIAQVTVDFDEKEFETKLKEELAKVINKTLLKSVNPVFLRALVADYVRPNIVQSPEYESLLSGELKFAFGLTDEVDKFVNSFVDELASSVAVSYKPMNKSTLSGGSLQISLSFANVGLLTQLRGAISTAGIPWVEWLLLAGDSIVVASYDVSYRNLQGRSGGAIMIPSASGFRVPPQFSGTAGNNWITRSLEGLEEFLLVRFQDKLDQEFGKV